MEKLLGRIGEGGPARIAEMYAERVDRKLDRPKAGHGRAATLWIRGCPGPRRHPRR
ncbi:hypothetical protein ACFOL3_02685 [Streptomyces nitrosporeus]